MQRSLLIGAVCLLSAVAAQQYISQGPVPQRPAAFSGATLAEPARPQVRQRTQSRTIQSEQSLPSRTQVPQQQQQVVRRRQPVARSRNLIQNERSTQFDPRITGGNVDGVYLKQRAPAPTAAPIQTTTTRLVTPKPVVEEEEDYSEEEEEETPAPVARAGFNGPFAPTQSPALFQLQRPSHPLPHQQQIQPQPFRPALLQQQQHQQQQQVQSFRPSQQLAIQQQSLQDLPSVSSPQPAIRQFSIRPVQQQRPILPASPVTRPPIQSKSPAPQSSEEEEDDEEPQYYRQRQQQKRPEPVSKPQPQRQQISNTPRPYPSKASQASQKEKKPVVQTVRKYHEENEDGSITWGYENDDGTFKEETIGNDCVTRGKYGYYDPEGVKREYTYQTGIRCDKEAEAEQSASNNSEGYIDYTSNKYVFPNGYEIDLDDMVKNRARKPVHNYRN